MHSQLAFVDRAYWKGTVILSLLRNLSGNRPRNQIWPNRNPCRTSPGTHPVAKVDPTLDNNSESASLWGREDVLSHPKALLQLPVVRRHKKNFNTFNSKGSAGSECSISSLNSCRAVGGLFSGSIIARRVASVPGETGAPSSACRVADNSPI